MDTWGHPQREQIWTESPLRGAGLRCFVPEFVIISNLSRPEKREARYTLFLFLRYTHSLVLHYLSWKPIAAPPGSADPSHLAIPNSHADARLRFFANNSGRIRGARRPRTDRRVVYARERVESGGARSHARSPRYEDQRGAGRHTTPCRMRHTPESVPFPNHRNGVTPLDPPVDGIPARPLWKALVSGLDTWPATGKLRPLCPPL